MVLPSCLASQKKSNAFWIWEEVVGHSDCRPLCDIVLHCVRTGRNSSITRILQIIGICGLTEDDVFYIIQCNCNGCTTIVQSKWFILAVSCRLYWITSTHSIIIHEKKANSSKLHLVGTNNAINRHVFGQF